MGKTRDETSGRLHICRNTDYLHAALGLGSFQSWMDCGVTMYFCIMPARVMLIHVTER